ncbi:hypothetical protein [Thalassomonas haliotis]|uniref:Multicopper oxidase n=1 Tax=Thalassomonas haliotis TaxID=485448 RepID=A0ABY7VM83_9GAMM|nr:hypothetical protein [Thalassomonas haliotis]WDE14287.1 hypothetical protein H3N35_13215 [Thalassomonas haliotis]
MGSGDDFFALIKRLLMRPVRAVKQAVTFGLLSVLVGSCAQAPYISQASYSSAADNRCRVGGKVERIVKVNMVALNQPFWYNRLGASQLNGMIFALSSDLIYTGGDPDKGNALLADLQAGKVGNYWHLIDNVSLRYDKRPRPIVLRANVHDCLEIHFTNLLAPAPQALTSFAGVHIEGTEVFSATNNNPQAIKNDGAYIGKNSNNLASPGHSRDYSLFIPEEGTFVLYSAADNFSNFFQGQLTFGLFGSLNVQPKGAEYYRSQVSGQTMLAATKKDPLGNPVKTASGQPHIDYQALYAGSNKPVLKMLSKLDGQANTFELIYSDPTAIITGPDAGRFVAGSRPFGDAPQYPQPLEPYREFNIMYHEPVRAEQAFAAFAGGASNTNGNTFAAGGDFFAINYGMAGIGPEIYSNRINVGPMYDCATCAYEEFFLSSWTVGDPAMVVDIPANFCSQNHPISAPTDVRDPNPPNCQPRLGKKATKAFYPDDPANVYHSYMNDHVKMRIHHGAGTLHHLHHLHAHQWLHSPNSDNSHYLDSQLIGPGSSFTLDMVYNSSGNRNQTVGDSIFHCHFYPHFAEGMWGLWRVHDVFEQGTQLSNNGIPETGSRALPDGEIAAGTPIPGIVPLPTIAMAPLPGEVHVENGQIVLPDITVSTNSDGRYVGKLADGTVYQNPGYPFFIPGIAGERAPHPPMDFAQTASDGELNGGLPRHVVYKPGTFFADPKDAGTIAFDNYDPEIIEYHNKFDFSKFTHVLQGTTLPEDGTDIEKVAMGAHATRTHDSSTPQGIADKFVLNGLLQQKGAPYADPCATNSSSQFLATPTPTPPDKLRQYRGVDMQMDVVLNKKGWHYSQQRFGVLWQDLLPTLNKQRPPEPLFFRANSGDCVNYWFANVVPEYYELDDFQVRTPTDILGQHIHLVKFDVTSSDGGANGWNYEDGTFSPQTVVERIAAFNKGKLDNHSGALTAKAPTWLCNELTGSNKSDCLDRAASEWRGAQTTVQRWYADPQLNDLGQDRTMRTVFTHDHFSPSTHQQAGLYMGLLIEPEGSVWKHSETGMPLNTRLDGGPTSWQAIIETKDPLVGSYREFMLEFQDFQLAYTKEGLRPQPCISTADGKLPATCYPKINETLSYGSSESFNQALDSICLVTTTNTLCQNQDVSGNDADYVAAIQSFTRGYSGYLAPDFAINPPQKQAGEVQTPTLISTTPPFALGTYSVNYRNEPLPFRVWDPTPIDSNGKQAQTPGAKGDLAYVYNSIKRADPELSGQTPAGASTTALSAGVYPDDPYTPLMRMYQGDKVQVRTLVGAHINMHNFSMQGFRWLFEPANKNSGYRSNQPMGISEHFEMIFDVPVSSVNSGQSLADAGAPTQIAGCNYRARQQVQFADYLYNPSSEENGLLNGNWGLMRAYQPGRQDLCLEPLPGNQPEVVKTAVPPSCPADANKRTYNVVTVTAAQLPEGKLIYSDRERLSDPNALLYFGCDVSVEGSECSHEKLLANLPSQSADRHIEPFVLRAAAGECITVNLANRFKTSGGAFPVAEAINAPNGQNALLQFRYSSDQATGDNCKKLYYDKWQCDMKLQASTQAALAPQLVSYDINKNNGVNLGFNENQSVPLGDMRTYTWYAGITKDNSDGSRSFIPAEFGSANLLTADPIKQTRYGMLAGMVIEPAGSCWSSQDGSKTTCSQSVLQSGGQGLAQVAAASDSLTGINATVFLPPGNEQGGKNFFREYVIMLQEQLAFSKFTNTINYGVERMAGKDSGQNAGVTVIDGVVQGRGRYRDTVASGANIGQVDKFQLDMACAFANDLGKAYPKDPDGTPLGEPETSIFHANPGDPVRFRVMEPHGADQHVFELFGHVWQEEPYGKDSTVITNNPDSQWQGSRMGVSAADRFDIVLPSAGGSFASPGDYLYRSYPGGDQNYGMWGIFRVGEPDKDYLAADIRPLVCVPQRNANDHEDLQYIYADKIFDNYRLPSGCTLVTPATVPQTVTCS